MRCVLVSCCGLPAAGKTSFCRSTIHCSTSGSFASTPAVVAESTTTAEPLPSGGPTGLATTTTMTPPPGAVVRVSHVCFDEHIDRARLRRHCGRHAPNNMPRTRDGETNDLFTACESEKMGRADGSKGDEEDMDDEYTIGTIGPGSGDNTTEAPALYAGSADGKGGADWWHEGRREAMAEIEALAAEASDAAVETRKVDRQYDAMPKTAEATAVLTEAGKPCTTEDKGEGGREGVGLLIHVVLADDNMHFRSMRQEVMRLARKYGCGYAQVYFPTHVEAAVERNETRATPVREAVIRKMAANIQVPDPTRFSWECHTAVIEPLDLNQKLEGVTECGKDSNPFGKDSNLIGEDANDVGADSNPIGKDLKIVGMDSNPIRNSMVRLTPHDCGGEGAMSAGAARSFWQVIAAAAEDPMPLLPDSAVLLHEQELDREATIASSLHQLDLELRKSVKRVADKAREAGLTREVHRQVMNACGLSRKTAMRRSRECHRNKQLHCDHDGGGGLDTGCEDGFTKENRGSCAAGGARDCTGIANMSFSLEEFAREFERRLGDVVGIEGLVPGALVEAASGLGCTEPQPV